MDSFQLCESHPIIVLNIRKRRIPLVDAASVLTDSILETQKHYESSLKNGFQHVNDTTSSVNF